MSPFAVAPFIRNLKSYFIEDIDDRFEYIANDGDEIEFDRSNVISTKGKDRYNYLLLDIDDNAEVWPSTTPGHYHIAFKRPLSDEGFNRVVDVLNEVGIIADGNYGQFKQGGKMYLRTPGVKKGKTKELFEKGKIGPTYDSVEEAVNELRKAARYLGMNLGYDINREIETRLTDEERSFW